MEELAHKASLCTITHSMKNITEEVVLISGVRTAVGKFGSAFKEVPAQQLGAMVLKEAVKRAGIQMQDVDEVIMGNVISAGLGQNPARQAAIYAGLPVEIGSLTINKVCGSGLKAVMLATQAIKAGDADIIVAGGMENMSAAPPFNQRSAVGREVWRYLNYRCNGI